MIEIKEAVQIAFEYIQEVFQNEKLRDLALEEIELTPNERYWLVTLGFTRRIQEVVGPRSALDDMAQALSSREYSTRVYKIIQIKAEDGSPVSIKIRNL